MTQRALVLGDDSRSTLAVVRSLGRAGVDVTLGSQDEQSIVRRSRYARSLALLPSSSRDVPAWAAALEQVLSDGRFDLVIPTGDESVVPMVHERQRFERLARCAIPDEQGFLYTYDKSRTFAMARELGVPHPETVCLATHADLERFLAAPPMGFPVVVKPASTWRLVGSRAVVLRASQARDANQLEQRVSGMLDATPVLLQAYTAGVGVGQEFLARDGEVVAAFQHERVHELPGGGGGSYRVSQALDPRILEHSTAMLRKLRWTGVAMVEWRVARDTGAPSLIEINGRFWGSLPLAVAAGADFPAWLFQMLVDGRPPARTDYRVGLYGRHVWNEIKWFPRNLLANRLDPHLQTYSPLRAVVEPVRILANRERWDTLTLDDPAPALAETLHESGAALRLAGAATQRAIMTLVTHVSPWRRRQRARASELLKRRPSVLFVCLGNICRSPFAEAYLRRRLAERGTTGIAVASAGFFPLAGRQVPRQGQVVAREHDVDLSLHRSSVVSAEQLDGAGVILCMDPAHIDSIRRESPQAAERAFLLRGLSDQQPGVLIPDPWGRALQDYRSGYRTIASAVDGLLAELSG